MKHPWWLVGMLGCAALCMTYGAGSAEVEQEGNRDEGRAIGESLRLRIDLKATRVRVETDLALSRSTGVVEDLEIYTAYASPGLPLAIDAQLVSWSKDADAGRAPAAATELATVASHRAPSATGLSIGSPGMAGRVIHVDRGVMTRARASGADLTVRLRDVRALPRMSERGVREMVVRLGRFGAEPVPLEHIQVSTHVELSMLQAETCGPSGNVIKVRVWNGDGWVGDGELPSRVRRDARDDLCVRFRFATDADERADGGIDGGAGGPEREGGAADGS